MKDEILCIVFCTCMPLVFSALMAFILTWQQLRFLKKDNEKFSQKIRSLESELANIKWKIRDEIRDLCCKKKE